MRIEHNFKMKIDDDLFISVFNLNDNEEKKALQCFKIIYGNEKFKTLKKLIKNGLMKIFEVEETDELVMFTLLITQIQNQRRY